MMDDTTVQTTPDPRAHDEFAGETIPITYTVTSACPSMGAEVTVLPGDREAPEHWTDEASYFSLRLHKDGSPCLSTCGCVLGQDRTHLYHNKTVIIGEWTWSAARSWAVGWHRTGPNSAELSLEARVDELEEELAQEQILHGLTREDVGACESDIEALKTRRSKIRGALRRWRKEATDAEHRYGIALQAAWAGWSTAIILAVYLVESGLS